MSALATLLNEPERLLRRLKQAAPEPRSVARWSNQLSNGSGDGGDGDVEDIEALQRRVTAALQSGAPLRPREIREACEVYLAPPHPPGRDPQASRELIQRVRELKRRSPLLKLIGVYLDRFNAEDDDIVQLGAVLEAMCPEWHWRPGAPWLDRANSFALFDPEAAPWRIATAVLESDQAVAKVLESAGLDTELRRRGGLAAAAFKRASDTCLTLSGHAAQPFQERLIEWARLDGGALAYPTAWSDYAHALFAPFRSKEPQEAHRTALIDAATSYANDPRVSEGRWRPFKDAHPDAYGVIMRWLTKASVEQFFDIVSETMRDRPDMWRARRAFWTDYLRRDLISEAWVVFGSDAAARAEDAARRSKDASLQMFGRLAAGGGRSSQHSALIMKIGDLTVVDWSHNGKWNIWTAGVKARPVLFRHNRNRWPDYEAGELMNGPINGSHDASGGWRTTVRQQIYSRTGLRP